MGRIMREFAQEEETTTTTSTASSLSEALLFTTMCIVGLPVEVHIKDGSIFSGIFHTASVDKGYGIALKKARMIKKGTYNANVGNGGIIDTLVVLPGDLVQVVAKGVMLPAESVPGEATCDDGLAVSGTSDLPRGSVNGAVLAGELMNPRQVGASRSREEEDGYHHDSEAIKEPEVNHTSTSLIGSYTKLNVHEENKALTTSNPLTNGSLSANTASLDVQLVNQLHDKVLVRAESVASEVSVFDATRNALPVPIEMVTKMAPQNPPASRTAKESKLNPSAKVFSPSLSNFRSTPSPVPTVPSVTYVPNSISQVQIAAPQPEVGVRPVAQHPSWPVKFVPYVTSTATNADSSLQYGQPIVGHFAPRTQPIRHGAQYQPMQALPHYVHPNPQNGIFGRPGQLVYVHPVSQDVIQAPGTLSQAPHPLLASHPIPVAKHEGAGVFAGQALQVSLTPPIMAGPQPYMMPSHIQLSQPLFSSMRSVPILGPNVPYGAKFP